MSGNMAIVPHYSTPSSNSIFILLAAAAVTLELLTNKVIHLMYYTHTYSHVINTLTGKKKGILYSSVILQ